MKAAWRIAAALALLALVMTAGGCWDYNDPEDLLYVMGAAFDRTQDGRLHATIEIATVSGDSQMTKPEYFEMDGDTFYDAGRSAIKIANRPLYWSHTQAVIVSQDIAKNSMGDLVDMLLRLPLVQNTLVLLVSKEATAGEVLKAPNPLGDLNSTYIIGSLKAERHLDRAPYLQLYQFADAIADERQSAVLPAIGLTDLSDGKTMELSGAAVFSGPWLQGFLDEYDTRTFMMLDYAKNIFDLPLPADPGGKFTSASVEFAMDRVDFVTDFADGRATLDIYILGRVTPVEISGASTDPDRFSTVANAIVENTATALENSAVAMIRHTQQMGGCDILSIGNRLQDSKPEVWRRINAQWRDYYNGLEVNVRAGLRLDNTGYSLQPIAKGE